MKKIIFTLTLLSSLLCSSENNIKSSDIEQNKETEKMVYKNTQKNVNGIIKEYYNSGKLKKYTKYKDGLIDEYKEFNKKNQLIKEIFVKQYENKIFEYQKKYKNNKLIFLSKSLRVFEPLKMHFLDDIEVQEYFDNGKLKYYSFKDIKNHDDESHVESYYINGKLKSKLSNPNGVMTEYYENGNTKSITPYYQGLPIARSIEYYEDGKIKELSNISIFNEQTTLFEGPNGISIQLDEDGKLINYSKYADGINIIDMDYSNGILENNTTEYIGSYIKYEPKSQKEYRNQKLNGIEKIYNMNSNLKHYLEYEINWKNNQKVVEKCFYPNSKNIKYIANYNKGILKNISWYDKNQENIKSDDNKIIQEFYKNGNNKKDTTIIDNKKNGLEIEYYQSGEIKSKKEYTNDQLSYIAEYSKNGDIIRRNNRVFDNMIYGFNNINSSNGIKIEYHDNHLIKTIAYKKNRQSQKFSFYENGQLKEDHKYLNGKLHGEIKEYYKNGKQKIKCNFTNGNKDELCKLYTRNI